MRLFVAWVLVVGAALGVAWLLAGRLFSLFVDRFLTIRVANLPVSPIQYDGGGFRIANLAMTFGALNNLPYAGLDLTTDATFHVILTTGGRSFTLGPRRNPVDPGGRTEIELVPDQGDQLYFHADRSAIGWPTPFEFSFMTPRSPWWKRYVYYRLVWQKKSGAKLEMLWRYEQHYRSTTGWTEPLMLWNSQTGLVRVTIGNAT